MTDAGQSLVDLSQTLRREVLVPHRDGHVLIRAVSNRKMRPVLEGFAAGMAKMGVLLNKEDKTAEDQREADRLQDDTLHEAVVGCLTRMCWHGDPPRLADEEFAELLYEDQVHEPTEKAAWRTALKMAGVIDLDVVEKVGAELSRKKKRTPRGKKAEVPKTPPFPPS